MTGSGPRIAILGASGLVGETVAEGLIRQGFDVTAVARHFTAGQANAFGPRAVTCPIADLDAEKLARLLSDRASDIVLNCLGVLQDGARGATHDVHVGLVERLLLALAMQERQVLLVHVSMPGRAEDDGTPFSRTKREAERLIAWSARPYVILRPGFVVAPRAYGGSALIRGLAALPIDLPHDVAQRTFASVASDDIVRTLAVIARRWEAGERRWNAVWDLLEDRPARVGDVVEAFRLRFGGRRPLLRLPVWGLRLGALAGDAAARLGWSPPVRTTALREMMRGVEGDPRGWMTETGIAPMPLSETLSLMAASIQERWFARLFLLKPLILICLVVFWVVSGLIALVVSFDAAAAILISHGFDQRLAEAATVVSSLADISVGLAIAWRKSCRWGLLAGIGLSLFYMASAVLMTPDLWVEPLGALVKTAPAIVLMLVALAILDER